MRRDLIYRRAAERVLKKRPTGEYYIGCCTAICREVLNMPHLETDTVCDPFKDICYPSEEEITGGYWWKPPALATDEEQNARCLALLFMAEIVKDEDVRTNERNKG